MGNEYGEFEYGDQNTTDNSSAGSSVAEEGKKKFNFKSLKFIGGVFLFFLICYGCLSSSKEEFPKLTVGSYIGEIKGVSEETSLPLFVESLPSNELFINVIEERSEPQRIPIIFNDKNSTIQPIIIIINGIEWKVVGSGKENKFSGELFEVGGKQQGNWKLKMIPSSESEFSQDDEKITEWAKLANQYELLKQEISSIKTQVGNQTKEIEKLTDFIVDADRLKARSEKKFRSISQKLDEKNVELKQVESEAQVLENRLALAQKVTDMGRLVLLARQTLERENRWINSALGGEVPFQGEDFQRELENAKKILSIKRAIQEEEEYIAHLRDLMAGRQNNNYRDTRQRTQRPSSFGSLWGDR